jgi:F-type H+-transporting ATPase subunit epsilon
MPVFFNFEIHTPYRLFFSGRADVIILTLADGEIGVYANHSPFTAPVVPCMLRFRDDENKWHNAFIAHGILEVKAQKNILMVDAAEWPEEINRERALLSKHEAEETLSDSQLKFEIYKAKEKLWRANCRLKVLDQK